MYTFESRVRYSEIDCSGRLSIAGLVNYFQDTSTFQTEDLGLGYEYFTRDARAWVINFWNIEIMELPKLGDSITMATWPSKFDRISGNRNYIMKDGNGRVLAQADSLWVLYNMEKKLPAKLTSEEIEKFGIEAPLDIEARSRKIKVNEEFKFVEELLINKERIDLNKHVNNAQYVQLAANYLPEGKCPNRICVSYVKPIMLGDKVKAWILEKEEIIYIRFTNEENEELAILVFEY